MLTFPSQRFDDLDLVLETIPSFWKDIYTGRDLVIDYSRGCVVQERQVDQLASELDLSFSRYDCPIYHTWIWLPIILDQSAGIANDDGSWSFPVQTDLVTASFLTDNITATTVCLAYGVEFSIDSSGHTLTLAGNPFVDPDFTTYTNSDGSVHIRVYLSNAQVDWRFLQNTWSSLLPLDGASTANLKLLSNALLDGVTGGSSLGSIMLALSAIADIPLAVGDETVETIADDPNGILVITDQNAYRFVSDANILVSAGDELEPGQSMTDGLQFWPTNQGVIPAGMTSITLDSDFLWQGISGPLTFSNSLQPITVVGVVSGYTKITFPITGAGGDVTAFFTQMHTRGVAAGKCLANYLDIRTSPVGQPTAFNLPTSVNPMQLLMSNALRSNLLLVTWKPGQFGPNNLGASMSSVVRQIVSPHTGLLIVSS